VNVKTAEIYARIRLQLKRKGKPIPENDIWIAAICVEHDVPLATSDGHFLEIDALKVVARQ
jgi:tRNA(fMet)-specific endonuclease VapC